ncbi:TonB-dependent receptor [Psychrosphaera sp. B3R10]|uniref:TonB-dependent receptor plug domain-containing protein n=1 Tax=unclassified Psychrosphaera TaxID=2641570 RepID=UPI001C08B045|nr:MULTISPECIES: TonB-dependent receptor [unclassified Psychrosphaera]MBU2882191.1 TonB-dependent receptor [Psychrosphaera sp. I2R16]MBU2988872.1 TonB-dependent receptor [Psychrosphaera sp. B3R10]
MIDVRSSLLLSTLLVAPFAHAKQDNSDLFTLSIEELLQVETSVAGFSSELIAGSPSVVTVFSSGDIQAYGVDNLYDLMNFVPGFQTTVGEKVGAQSKLQSRGVYLDNGYVLVMIDGVRINEVSFGKASVYTPFINLETAEKVEIIRGPGSAKYGSNAFLGVINIVTKKDDHLAAGIGSNGQSRFSFGLTESLFNGTLAANFSFLEADGQKFIISDQQTLNDVETRNPYEHQQMAINWSNANFELGYRKDSHKQDGFINLNGYHPLNYYLSENQYWYGKTQYSFNPKTQLSAQLEYADHLIESAGFIESSGIAPFSHDVLQGPYWGTDRYALQANISHQYSESLEFSVGVEVQRESQVKAGVVTTHVTDDGQSTSPAIDAHYQNGLIKLSELGDFEGLKDSITSRAWFGELQWQIDDQQKVFIGGRYENYNSAGDAFSPRIAYIRKLDQQHQIKAIYSQAFRAPVTNELYSNDGVTVGNSTLKPELVETSELQWLMTNDKFMLETTLFHTKMTDLIVYQELPSNQRFTFFNSGSTELNGIELLSNVDIAPNLSARASYTHIFSDTVNAQYDHFATASLFWSNEKWRSNVHVIYRPASSISQGFTDGNEQYFSETSQFIVNLSLHYQMGRNLSFQFAVENLNDNQYNGYEPRQSLNDFGVPQPRRQMSINARYAF